MMKWRKGSHEQFREVARMIKNDDWTVGFNISVLAFSEVFFAFYNDVLKKIDVVPLKQNLKKKMQNSKAFFYPYFWSKEIQPSFWK